MPGENGPGNTAADGSETVGQPSGAATLQPKGSGLFRAEALARLSATEDLDRPARLAVLPHLPVLLAGAAVCAAAGAWLLLA